MRRLGDVTANCGEATGDRRVLGTLTVGGARDVVEPVGEPLE
jgi:hypothetical protein